ncbi:MAG: Ulp1 family isopeptidase, partial [Candidatus Staskawiczbacteria bacterium]|nr:Ulp1 family isopeptidase [Candidatus Staskawiczbacteria bacterium]
TVITPAATIFENAELLPNSTRNAVQAALAGNIVAMPIHLHGNHWVGAIFRRQADGAIQVIYNNPQGYVIDLEPNAVRFVATIQAITQNVTPDRAPNIIDLHLWQQCNGVDCGPFTVDNLVRLARYAYDHAVELDGLDRNGIIARAGLQHPADGDASTIRAEHHPIFTALGLQVPTETVEDDGLFNPDEDNDFSEEVTDPIDVVNTVDPFFLVSPTFEFGKQPISSANSIYGYGNNTSFYKSFLEEDSLLPVPIWSVNRHPSRLGFLFSDQVALPSYSRTSRPISIFFIQPRFSWDDYNIYSKFVLPKK